MNGEGKRNFKILIVEDDVLDAKLLKQQLVQTELSITKVSHTERLQEALDLLEHENFDVVLLDMNLPDSRGVDTLKQLHKAHPKLTIINVTGGTDEQVALQALASGAQDYLIKGRFDPYVLSKSILYSIERKKTEEALRESKGKLDAMLEAISDHMTMVDRDMTIIWANSAAKKTFGSDMERKYCYEIYRGKTERCPIETCSLNKVFETGQVYSWNTEIQDKNGNIRYFHSTGNVALRNDEGEPEAVIEISRDVTKAKEAEQSLIEANKELEEANREMKQMQTQLVQNEKLAAIGQLAAGVAHEMNTPVGFVASNFSTLRNYVKKFQTLLDMYSDLTSEIKSGTMESRLGKMQEIEQAWQTMKMNFVCEDIEDLFTESKEGLNRVTSIIQNLRDFSRIDQAEDFDEYDLNSGIEATLIVAKNEIKYDAEIKTELCDSLLVRCNSGQVNQVFLNILVNASQAIKSMEREENGIIEIKTYSEDGWAVCIISDNGPGIPQEVLSKIFDPFFTTKPAGKGTGLGLSVSYDIIVNKHKGLIQVETEIGKGTKFFIKLPLNNREQKQQETVLAETQADGQ
jgi:PAS domain S-box-containing protein